MRSEARQNPINFKHEVRLHADQGLQRSAREPVPARSVTAQAVQNIVHDLFVCARHRH